MAHHGEGARFVSKDGKKPGPRDISDLKARLGLKKGEAKGGGAIPPPGAARIGGAFVPPPPGVAPPEPKLPDARVDPFGAMNAMAAQGAVARAPEIIVVDKHSVEKVEKTSLFSRGAKPAAIALALLIVGFLLGGINYERRRYNANLADAKAVFEEVKTIGRGLNDLNVVLLKAKERGGGRYKLWDMDLVKELAALNYSVGDDPNLILGHQNLYALKPKLVQDTIAFYSRLRTLSAKIKEHIRLTKEMQARLPPDPVTGGVGFAALVRVPTADEANKSGIPTRVELVQLGQYVCGGQLADECKDPAAQQMYRTDVQATWQPKARATGTDTGDKLVILKPNGVFEALQKGSAKYLDELQYWQRITEIETLVHGPDGESGLLKDGKDIEDGMNNIVRRGKAIAL
jgi:hypothetical protein